MKKSLLSMLVFGISLFISSIVFAAPNHGDIEDCDGLDGEAYELCESYCFAKACATDDPNGNPKSCAALKRNFERITGSDVLPCDIPDITKTYVGSEACQTCHPDYYSDFINSGHPYKFNLTDQDSPAEPTYPGFVDNYMALPQGASDWSEISGVIGGFGWKARYVDNIGMVVGTLNSIINTGGGENQLNFFPAYVDINGGPSFTNYNPTNEKQYNYGCFKCHTTGAVSAEDEPDKNWLEDLLGIANDEDLGFFEFGGIQCEACHGPGSAHVDAFGGTESDRLIDNPEGEAVNDLCGTCHTRLANREVAVSGDYIRHHEQYDEFIKTEHYVNSMTCDTCHDPHKRVIWEGDGIIMDCQTCHPSITAAGVHAIVDCITCHMPYAAKSAQETGYLKGDIRSHTFAINSDEDYEMIVYDPDLDTDVLVKDGDGQTNLELKYVCYQCHQTEGGDGGAGSVKTLSELSDYSKNILHQ